MPFGYDSEFDVADLGTLSAVGVSAAQRTTGAALAFQLVVSGVGTNVVVRLEGSLDDVSYFNLNASGSDFTLTSDGATGYFLTAPVKYVRFRLVSITGGTPTVNCLLGTI